MQKTKISFKKKILFLVFLLCFIFLIAELGMRLYASAKGKTMPAPYKALAKEWTWAKAHLEAGKAEFESIHMFDPHLGWKLRSNIRRDDLITNSSGMRNEKDFAKANPNQNRILFVGDSYTYGSHVKNDEIYTYFLQKSLPEWDILNMGVGGTGTDQNLVMYEQYGKEYNPQIVVLGFFIWDFFRNFLSFRSYLKPYFDIKNNEIVLKKDHIIPPQQLYNEYKTGVRSLPKWHQSHLLNKVRSVIDSYNTRNLHSDNKGFAILGHMMERFSKKVKATGATPIWLIIPNRDVVKENYRYEPIQDFCEKKCKELGIHYLRLDTAIIEHTKKYPNKNIYRPKDVGGHFSAIGHQLTAKEIYSYLKDKNLLSR